MTEVKENRGVLKYGNDLVVGIFTSENLSICYRKKDRSLWTEYSSDWWIFGQEHRTVDKSVQYILRQWKDRLGLGCCFAQPCEPSLHEDLNLYTKKEPI